jgi:hypothetical protein
MMRGKDSPCLDHTWSIGRRGYRTKLHPESHTLIAHAGVAHQVGKRLCILRPNVPPVHHHHSESTRYFLCHSHIRPRSNHSIPLHLSPSLVSRPSSPPASTSAADHQHLHWHWHWHWHCGHRRSERESESPYRHRCEPVMSQSATFPGQSQRERKKDGKTYLGALDARCIFLRHEALAAAAVA